jgi:hypothetical protein
MIITRQDILDSKYLTASDKAYLLGSFEPEVKVVKCNCNICNPKPKVTSVAVLNKKSFDQPMAAIYKNGKRYDKIMRVEENVKQVTEIFHNEKANEYLYTQDGEYVNDSYFYNKF